VLAPQDMVVEQVIQCLVSHIVRYKRLHWVVLGCNWLYSATTC